MQKVTSSWFFLSTLNYDARSTTHQIVFSISPAEILRAVNNVCLCVTLVCIPMESIACNFFKRND